MPVYARAPVAFERGEGAYLFDEAGKPHLDFCSGVAVTALGHGHPRLNRALAEQAAKVWHTSNLFRVNGQTRVADLLCAHSFADTVFFTNSGVEAWECAAKLVRKFHSADGHPEKNRMITVTGAFHGRTLAAISATKQEKMTAGFGPLLEGFDLVPFGNLNELRNAITPETAAINIEPVLGEGGIKPASAEYLRGLRAACDEYGLLLFFDEIQTGIGRTGKLFAHEWAGVTPDVMCIAKGLGGGFPVGACLATERAAKGMTAGAHGSTFGGNPLAMAVAEEVLKVVLEEPFLANVQRVAAYARTTLEAWAKTTNGAVEEVRGLGLMLGLKLADPINNREFFLAAIEQGLVTVVASENVVRLLPPLIIEERHIDEAVAKLDATLRAVAPARAA
jgi:acetylornithine/N-succinyldiaminopimelate aminotransferase